MSEISKKVQAWLKDGVPTRTGRQQENDFISNDIIVAPEDSKFVRSCLERLEMEGDINTPEEYDEAEAEVQELVKKSGAKK